VVEIPLSGQITVTATAQEIGDIRAGAGEINAIATPIRGWQSVNNPAPAVPGAPVESDAALRQRQSISTMLPSSSIFDGTLGAVSQISGVIRLRGYENDTNEVDGNGIPPHSISLVVEGGDTQAIADAVACKKGPGCGTYGDIAVLTHDSKGVPGEIRFYRPITVHIAVVIRIKPLAGYLAITGERIRQNIYTYLNALQIGDTVLISKLYTPANAAEPEYGKRTFDVIEILLGLASGPLAQANMAIAFNAAVACAIDDIAVQDY
jgi:uncharacterized phage protein gp47/JayE